MARAATPKKWARSFQSIVLPADELQVRLVDEGGGLERVARPLVSEVRAGAPAQLVVHEREELFERRRVPARSTAGGAG